MFGKLNVVGTVSTTPQLDQGRLAKFVLVQKSFGVHRSSVLMQKICWSNKGAMGADEEQQ